MTHGAPFGQVSTVGSSSGWSVRLRAAAMGLLGLAAMAVPGLSQAQETRFAATGEVPQMRGVNGMIMLDYSPITLTTGGAFDLASYRYLQRTRADWLYFGIGAFAPLVRGNVGGFYGAEGSLHAQRQIGNSNWFVNGGLSFGVGAGGDSILGIRAFSGQGLFGRGYVGLGYRARHLSFGVNYSRIAIAGSPVNDSTLTFFVQRPLGFAVGSYADSGRTIRADQFESPRNGNILSFHLSRIGQINPTGSHTGPIGVMSPQFTHFMNRDFYTFFGVEIGITGLDWYNQAQAGFGYRFALSPRTNLYAQLGIGSGGWVNSHINTGAGLVLYPRLTMEYMINDRIGAQVSAGYFWAPTGTSRNWTISAGLAYHMSRGHQTDPAHAQDVFTMHGVRLNVMARTTSTITYSGRQSEGISMLAVQADYSLTDRWFASAQIAAATEDFRTFAGYAEGFFGLGWQSRPFAGGRAQAFAQFNFGLNDVGVTGRNAVGPLIHPTLGVNYHLNDRVSLYGQIGMAQSIGHLIDPTITNRFENSSIGLGVTYRFALPAR